MAEDPRQPLATVRNEKERRLKEVTHGQAAHALPTLDNAARTTEHVRLIQEQA